MEPSSQLIASIPVLVISSFLRHWLGHGVAGVNAGPFVHIFICPSLWYTGPLHCLFSASTGHLAVAGRLSGTGYLISAVFEPCNIYFSHVTWTENDPGKLHLSVLRD